MPGEDGREPEISEDQAIVQRVLGGQVDAFGLLLERYQGYIFSIIAPRVPQGQVAETAHETFVKAYRSLGSYSGSGELRHWLARIAVRTCHDYWRKHYRQPETPVSGLSEECREWIAGLGAEATGAELARQRREARELLDWALAHLAPDDRMVLTRVYFDEQSMRETAELMGWSESKTKVRAHRARARLREILEEALEASATSIPEGVKQ